MIIFFNCRRCRHQRLGPGGQSFKGTRGLDVWEVGVFEHLRIMTLIIASSLDIFGGKLVKFEELVRRSNRQQ